MSVFICNLKSLYGKDVYNEFCKGHISVKKSNRVFSSIGEDYTHEQINIIIKGDGDVIGIFDHEKALLEWAVCGPAVADMFQDLPDTDEDDYYWFHHESTDNFEKTFWNGSNNLFEDFLHNGNPFIECEQDLVNVVLKTAVNKESLKCVQEALSIGIVEKLGFIEDHLVKETKSLYDDIKMSKLSLLNPKVASKSSKRKQKDKFSKSRMSLVF